MTRVAALGMYDSDGVRDANDRLWSLVAARLIDGGLPGVPARLERERPLEDIWSDPKLLLAQCCGYPLVSRFRECLRVVATPVYDAPGCEGPRHRSRIVIRAADAAEGLLDLKGRRAAINERTSNSGTNLFRATIAPLAGSAAFFADVIETGSHHASLRALIRGEADVAAIDTVSYAHLVRSDPRMAEALRTIGWTGPSPNLPFVTAIDSPDALVRQLRAAIADAIASDEARPIREALRLTGIERVPIRSYDRLLRWERDAAHLGYPELV